MRLDRLMWLCAGLFVAFGLPLAVVGDGVWRNALGGLSVLSLGGFGLAMAGDGIVRGRIRVQFSVIRRAAQPRAFWAAVAVAAAAGLGVIASGIWVMFLKP